MGELDNLPAWDAIIEKYKGSELHSFFTNLLKDEYKSSFKVQFVDKLPKMIKGTVQKILEAKKQREQFYEELLDILELRHLIDRKIENLSGGEL